MKKLIATAALATLAMSSLVPAANASTVVAPATQVMTTQQVGVVDHTYTDSYTGHLADRLLGTVGDLVLDTRDKPIDFNDQRVVDLSQALNHDIKRFGAIYQVSGVQWAKMSDTRIVVRNTTSAHVRFYLPTTGAEYVLAPYSGNIVYGKPAPLTAVIPPVFGAIGNSYLSLGGPDVFGYAVTGEVPIAGGVKQTFAGGTTFYWSLATGVNRTKGAIGAKYLSVGESAALGFPTSNEMVLSTGGVVQFFQKGRIYWSPATGAHITKGAIGNTYYNLGGSGSMLGYPTTDEIVLWDGSVIQYYQNGNIGWSQNGSSVSVNR